MEKKFITNRYGCKIVKCCASCKSNLGSNSETSRICCNGEGIVSLSYCCDKWELKVPSGRPKRGDIIYDNAGMGGGRVKKKKYIDFVCNYDHPEDDRIPVKQIREEYTKKYGSIYIN